MITENVFFRHADENRVRVPVRKTTPDEQRIYPAGDAKAALNFLTDRFLTDRKTWKTFVEQFRFNADGESRGWRCEYWGKMMRGAAYVCAVTRDPELYAVLKETVEDLLTAQDGLGRFSTYAPETEFDGWDIWGRKYVLLGMLRFLDICDDDGLRQRIIDAMTRHGEYLAAHIGPAREGKLPVGRSSNYHRGMNSLSVLEPVVLLYELTGKQSLLRFADYLVEEGSEEIGGIFRLAAEDKLYPYQYPHTKAYEMTSCFEGLLEYARVTGKKEKLQAVINFAYRALEAEISVIGCAGSIHEYFDHTNARQTSFFYKGAMQETCVTVTWMKFCARMLAVTGDPIFADAFEQSLENAYYGALNVHENLNTDQIGVKYHVPGVGVVPRVLPFDSYSPLLLGRRGKGIGGLQTLRDGDYYGCCACIGAAGVGIAPRLSVLPTETGFGIYLYTDTTVQTKTPAGNRIAFVFSGNYPVNGSIRLVICPERPETFDLALRVPSWSEQTVITVNDEPVCTTHGMTVIRREWGINDVVRVTFDLRVEALRPAHYGTDTVGIPVKNHSMVEWHTDTETPENHAFVALRRGPLMLARDARLNEGFAPVRLDAESDAYVEADVASASGLSFPARCRLTVHGADGSCFTAVDYASAGKTWSDDSQCEVWLPKA